MRVLIKACDLLELTVLPRVWVFYGARDLRPKMIITPRKHLLGKQKLCLKYWWRFPVIRRSHYSEK